MMPSCKTSPAIVIILILLMASCTNGEKPGRNAHDDDSTEQLAEKMRMLAYLKTEDSLGMIHHNHILHFLSEPLLDTVSHEVYRFWDWAGLDVPSVFRIENTGAKIILNYRIFDLHRRDGTNRDTIYKTTTRVLRAEDWATFKIMIETSSFWSMESDTLSLNAGPSDAGSWQMEGVRPSAQNPKQYRDVSLTYPAEHLQDIHAFLAKLAGERRINDFQKVW